MTIKDNVHFVYDGQSSTDLGIINVSVEEVWVDEPFLATTEINSIKTKGKDKSYFMGVTREPLRLNLTFAFVEGWNEDLIQEVAMLFHTDYYKPLYFSDNEDRIFYCMYSGDPRILHYKLKQGYIEMELVCNDICAYSKIKEQTILLPVSEQEETVPYDYIPVVIAFNNKGNLPMYPEIIITMNDNDGNESVIIENTRTNKTLILNDLLPNEQIYINGEHELIQSNTSLHRYNNHNNVFLEMIPGRNDLAIVNDGVEEGKIKSIKFKWQYKILQG